MAVRKRGMAWQIDYRDPHGKRIRKTFKKKKDAVAELAKRKSLIAEGRYLDVKKDYKNTLGELVDRYQENFGHKSSYKSAKRFFIASIVEHFGEHTLLGNIDYYQLESYRNHLKHKPTQHGTIRKDASVNREMSCLRHMLAKAVSWKMMEKNPFLEGDSLFIKENNARTRFLSDDDIKRLLMSCTGHTKDIVECVLHTGMRRGEVLGLKWDQVKNGFIYLKKTKTNNPRQIPINSAVQGILSSLRHGLMRDGKNAEHVFTVHGEPVKDVKTAFQAALKRAEIEDFHFHDLRHTFASQLVQRGASLKSVQELLGHKNVTMTLRYSHLSPEHRTKAVSLLDGLSGDNGHKMVTKIETRAQALAK